MSREHMYCKTFTGSVEDDPPNKKSMNNITTTIIKKILNKEPDCSDMSNLTDKEKEECEKKRKLLINKIFMITTDTTPNKQYMTNDSATFPSAPWPWPWVPPH